jgi:site-specific DNA-methyltransferase (adenine-specific)
MGEITKHYATYPIDLIKPLIMAGSKEGDLVLDPFNGSGTTCFVSKLLNRNYIGIEISPKYCQIARERLSSIPPSLF